MTVRKGVCYFPTFQDARIVRGHFPGSRIVEYQTGFAVQWRKGGRYVGLTDLIAFGVPLKVAG